MSVERLAFDLVVSKLDSQRIDLNNLRSQARGSATITGLIGALFAGFVGPSLFATTLFGETLFGFSLPAALLFLTFIASITLSCMVLADRENVTFSFNTETLISKGETFNSDKLLFRSYVVDGELFFRDNEAVIEKVQWKLWWATVLGWAQIFPWIVLIAENSNV